MELCSEATISNKNATLKKPLCFKKTMLGYIFSDKKARPSASLRSFFKELPLLKERKSVYMLLKLF